MDAFGDITEKFASLRIIGLDPCLIPYATWALVELKKLL